MRFDSPKRCTNPKKGDPTMRVRCQPNSFEHVFFCAKNLGSRTQMLKFKIYTVILQRGEKFAVAVVSSQWKDELSALEGL